jgi:hypothetical protein
MLSKYDLPVTYVLQEVRVEASRPNIPEADVLDGFQGPGEDTNPSADVRGKTVPSRSDAVLEGLFAHQGGMKDWVDIDPGALDHRGNAIYECSSEINCKSIKKDYIELPIGTSDVEVALALGGLGEVVGGLWKGLGQLGGAARVAESADPLVGSARTKLLDGQQFNGGDCVIAAKTAAKELGLPTETLAKGSEPGIFAVHSRFPQMGGEAHYAVQLSDGRIVDTSLLGNIETHANARLPAAERATLEGVDTFTREEYAAVLDRYFK